MYNFLLWKSSVFQMKPALRARNYGPREEDGFYKLNLGNAYRYNSWMTSFFFFWPKTVTYSMKLYRGASITSGHTLMTSTYTLFDRSSSNVKKWTKVERKNLWANKEKKTGIFRKETGIFVHYYNVHICTYMYMCHILLKIKHTSGRSKLKNRLLVKMKNFIKAKLPYPVLVRRPAMLNAQSRVPSRLHLDI